MSTAHRFLTRCLLAYLLVGTVGTAPTLSKQSVSNRGTFAVTCHAMSFDDIPKEVKTLIFLNIGRKTILDDDFRIVASYSMFSENSSKQFIPNGRHWDITMTGGNVESGGHENIDTVRVQLKVNDACCSDTGQYRCIAVAADDEKTYSTTADITCRDKLLRLLETKNNVNTEGKHELLCTAAGQLKMNVNWMKKRGDEEINILPEDDRVETVGPVPSHDCNGCLENLFMTKLSMWPQDFDRGSIYYCVVSDGAEELSRTLATLTWETTENPPDVTQA